MALPEDDYEDRGENDRRKRFYAAAARAAKLYADALRSSGGADARKYLQGRGIGPDEWTRFGIGLAPDEWTWATDKLKAEGFTLDEIVSAGIAREGEDGKRAIDTFRGRITFEITDPSGKIIGFGGRALATDAKAKYINSPETPLYSKGRVLYRIKQARDLLAKTKAPGLVVGEGYLDVIAFERAGIAAVAPCGTALTEEQLQLLWRSGGEPVLCFDGDSAGKRAADRALDLALPHLAPERTVRIALLPEGEDPDDLYRRLGPDALQPIIAAAQPASIALFERERARRELTTPEARAAFKHHLREAANKIADAETKRAYLSDLLSRADEALRPPKREWQPPQQGGGPRKVGRFAPPAGATAELKAAAGSRRPAAENFLRAAVDHPGVLARYADWIDRLHIPDPELEAVRAALLALSGSENNGETIDREGLSRHLHRSGEERAAARVSRWPKLPLRKGLAQAAPDADLEAQWLALAAVEVVLPAIREELAELAPRVDDDEDALKRYQALSKEATSIKRAALTPPEDRANGDDADNMVA
jgi:DNA primase